MFAGSSPLTRGKPSTLPATDHLIGLIPAHAGKTAASRGPSLLVGAHPRSRGENRDLLGLVRAFTGSSPLTRGKPWRRCPRRRAAGLIPAHAGKTPPSGPCRARGRAHPRSRGENGLRGLIRRPREGSSPLTRGKHAGACARPHSWGLIPAHAGKTGPNVASVVATAAHPRSRGENSPQIGM